MRILISLLFICTLSVGFGQTIRLKVTGAKDTTVFLTRYYGSKLFYADTAEMKGGVVEFPTKDLKTGMFALVLPQSKFFEFIVAEDDINIETNISDLVGMAKVKKSEENKVFIAYVQYLKDQRTKADKYKTERDKFKEGDADYKKYDSLMNNISKEVKSYLENVVKTNKDRYVGKVLKMSIEITLPEAPKNEKGEVIDPLFQLRYLRAHYWDNTDLNDDRLVNTPLFGQKVEYFYGKNLIVPHQDSILAVAIPFIDKLKKGSDMFRFHVDYLTNWAAKSKQMGIDKVYLNMVKRYYCSRDENGKSYAFWMPENKLESACEDIDLKLKLCIGEKPANVILPDTSGVWRDYYSLKSDYTILFFWEPTCGHCKKTAPKLQRLYEEKLKARNVEVFAVGKATGEDEPKWKEFIKTNKLSFINVALTQKLFEAAMEDARQFVPKYTTLESLNYAHTFNIESTPTILILDKNKKIIAKRLTISQIEDMLDHLQEIKDPVKLFPPDPEEEAN